MKIKSKAANTALIVIAAVILLGALAGAGYFYKKYNDLQKDPNAIAKEETDKLVQSVGKLMALPADETPSIATVTDKEKLKDQPFFTNAENGDKVLIYTKAKKAILYRPSTGKVVEVMPIAFNDAKPAAPAPTPVK